MSRFAGGVRSTFSSLRVRNYRLFFAGQVVSVTGTWMQMIAQAWLVLNITGSAADLGLVTAFQFLPTLLLGPYAGVLADRFDKRRILLTTQAVSMTLALLLGVLAATGHVRLWMVVALAGGLGMVGAFDGPARQTFVLEMVGPGNLANALSLNTVTMNVGRLFGPAVAGVVIAKWDLSVCFIANGLSYIAAIIALLLMRPHELLTTERAQRAKGQLRDGFRYVWANPALRVPLLLMLAVGTLTYEFAVTMPVLAKRTFHVGAAGFGAMQSSMSIGAVVGGLLFATRTAPTFRRLVLAAIGFGTVVVALAMSPTYLVGMLVLPLVGVGSVLFVSLANATLQLASPPEMRSRVMALYAVAFIGSTPIGGPIIGWISQRFGVRWGLGVGGVAAVLGGIAAARSLRGVHGPTPTAEPAPAELDASQVSAAADRPPRSGAPGVAA